MDTIEKVARRADVARKYRLAAETLSSDLEDYGPSSVVLSVLSFEIYLKAAILLWTNIASGGHNYDELWTRIPDHLQSSLISIAKERNGGHVNYSDMSKLMDAWRRCFEKWRYEYEVNEKRTLEEIRKVSSDWDGSAETADFAAYSLELDGIIFALDQCISQELGRQSD
jgi:HEPN domain-containing protein